MNRRKLLHSSVALACGLAGCLDGQSPLSSSADEQLPCPSSVSRIERADYDGAFQMECSAGVPSETPSQSTALTPEKRSVTLSPAENSFTLTNRRETYYNSQFYNWELLKHVDGEWYSTVGRRFSASSASSLPPGRSHTWSITVTNDELGEIIRPVESDESIALRGLGGGTYAFVVVGSYGSQGESWSATEPIVGYAAPFTLKGEQLPLVPTNAVRHTSREGDSMTVTADSDDPRGYVTVAKRPDGTPNEHSHRAYITESVYGTPAVRDVLAHFEEGVTSVTLRADRMLIPPFTPEMTLTYDGTMYEVTDFEIIS